MSFSTPLTMLLSCPSDVESLAQAVVGTTTFKTKAPDILCVPLAKKIPYCMESCQDEEMKKAVLKLADVLCQPLHCNCFMSSPEAADDETETELNTSVTIDLLSNDLPSSKFCPFDAATLEILIPPVNGTLVNNLDGTVTYTPALGYVGSDQFQYKVYDECCQCDTAVVIIEVTDADIPPSCEDIEDLEVTQNEAIDIVLTSYYTIGSGAVNLATGFTIERAPLNGVLLINVDGTATYTPNLDFLGNDYMEVRVTDANGEYCIIGISISVIPPVLIPIVCNDDEYTITFNTQTDFPVTENDITDDLCDIIGSVCLVETPSNGVATALPSGLIRYMPDLDWCGVDTFSYMVTDSCGRSCEAEVTVNVLPPGTPVESCQILNTPGCSYMAFTMDGDIDCPSTAIVLYVEDECGKIVSIPTTAAIVTGCLVLIEISIWNALLKPNCFDIPLACNEVKSIGCGTPPSVLSNFC